MSGRPWNQTFSGLAFDLVRPDRSMVSIKDIAQSLANLCRFNGHSKRFYSVAEHSLYVSRAVPHHLALQGLLHDATEAYVGDMVAPLKSLLPEFKDLENRVRDAICARFGLPVEMPVGVRAADRAMLATELEYLMLPPPQSWELGVEPYKLHEIGLCHPNQFGLSPREAHRRFLERFAELAV
ncbi:putative hydrolases of HD superfamily [Desulfovibrio sp. DV]|uniref:hypothetical protein n=1 Tax=Desulfovibrio sp. DV TaxID=1844708 RepID=UPI00094B8804|nr:hypothetical protein [Desulfovibrio sp. DV]OLN31306.1 putative hydrolases of HD superfamily [Desulfovibrio sp. DV]